MQTIQGIAESLQKATDQIVQSITSAEKHTAVGACVVALHHANVAIIDEPDHLRARRCLFALQPFRNLANGILRGGQPDLISAGYTCAVALKTMKIDEEPYVHEMIGRLGKQLPENKRKAIDTWVDEQAEKLPGFKPEDDEDGWAMVQLMIDGETCFGAWLRRNEGRLAARKLKEYVEERNKESNEPIGKALPNGGSLVVGQKSSTVHFGLGGGSVTVLNGKLSYNFPAKRT